VGRAQPWKQAAADAEHLRAVPPHEGREGDLVMPLDEVLEQLGVGTAGRAGRRGVAQ
jgi:hypothetical protein